MSSEPMRSKAEMTSVTSLDKKSSHNRCNKQSLFLLSSKEFQFNNNIVLSAIAEIWSIESSAARGYLREKGSQEMESGQTANQCRFDRR
jgi:hypothetical protein